MDDIEACVRKAMEREIDMEIMKQAMDMGAMTYADTRSTDTLTMEFIQQAIDKVKEMKSITSPKYLEIAINPLPFNLWDMLRKYAYSNSEMLPSKYMRNDLITCNGIPIRESKIVPEGMLLISEWDKPVGTFGANLIRIYYTREMGI